MNDKVDYITNSEEIISIADAIRSKGGTSAQLKYPGEFVSAIQNIQTQLPWQEKTVSPSTSDQSVTHDEGKALSKVTVSAMPVGSATTPATTKAQSTPSISVNSSGLITASVAATSVSVTPTVSAGYVSSGTAGTITMSASSATKQLSTKGATTISPSTSPQTAVSAGTYCTGAITVSAISCSGTYTPKSRSSELDMGASNTYRYVNTNSVPNTNSDTYKSLPNKGKTYDIDMGDTNTYRYFRTDKRNWYKDVTYSTGDTFDTGFYVGGHSVFFRGSVTVDANFHIEGYIGFSDGSTCYVDFDNDYVYMTRLTDVAWASTGSGKAKNFRSGQTVFIPNPYGPNHNCYYTIVGHWE